MSNQNNKRRGKDMERNIAKLFNGLAIGTLCGEDVITDDFSIECKSRMKFIGDTWYTQAVNNNKRKKIPLVVVHIKNRPYESDYVLINIKDFLKLIKGK